MRPSALFFCAGNKKTAAGCRTPRNSALVPGKYSNTGSTDGQELFSAGFFADSGPTFVVLRLFGTEFFSGELLGGGEGVGGGNSDVGLDAGSFPVGFRDRVDGAGKGHANHKMVVDPVT